MVIIADGIESNRDNLTTCLSLAVVFHLLLLLWNPVVFRDAWRTMTALGDGEVFIVDIPGPETTALPGTPAAPLGGRSLHKPLSPGVSSTDLGRNHSGSIEAAKTFPGLTAAPLIQRQFPPMRTPELPFEIGQGLSGGETAIPIAIEKGSNVTHPTSYRAPLKERDAGRSPFTGLGAGAPFPGEGGTGRAIIRLTAPETPAQAPQAFHRPPGTKAAGGPSIEGPLSNRRVMHRVIPDYPAWAEEQGIMGTARLYFTVSRDGQVQSSIRIDRTSGSPELDRLAIDALRRWRFSAAVSDDGAQWGIITFTFSLGRE